MSARDIQFEAEDESDSVGFSILYPILGSVFVIICVVSIAAFILSNRRCRKKGHKNTESEILKDNLCKDKEKMAQSTLVLNTDGKPKYTSITQQEDNEIAEEVRESYKTIATSDNKPIACCPEQAGYLYHPVQCTEIAAINQERKHTKIEITDENKNKKNKPVGHTATAEKKLSTGVTAVNQTLKLNNDHINNERFLDSLEKRPNSSYQYTISGITSSQDKQPYDQDRYFDSLEKRSTGSFHYAPTEGSTPPETKKSRIKERHTRRNKQEEKEAKKLMMSKWMQEEEEEDPEEDENTVAESEEENVVVEEFESSFKTQMELNYEDVDSILTSVSRMDTRRVRKLRETSFYQNLQHKNETNARESSTATTGESPEYSEDSIEMETLDDNLEHLENMNSRHSLSHEEILSLGGSRDCSVSYSNDDDDNDVTADKTDDSDEDIDVSSSRTDQTPVEINKNKNKQSFKKPFQYIDKDSESFFKIVRPAINPDEFSESTKTGSDYFRRSKGQREVTESVLSDITYSYDKHSHFIIVDDKKSKNHTQEQQQQQQQQTVRPIKLLSISPSNTSSSASTSNKFESITSSARPGTLDLDQRNNDLSIDMSTSYESQYSTLCSSPKTESSETRFIRQTDYSSKSGSIRSESNRLSTHELTISQKYSDTDSETDDSFLANNYLENQQKSPRSDANSVAASAMTSATTSATSQDETATAAAATTTASQHRNKYKSIRGNFSAYISSRQCAASAKTGSHGKINNKKDGKQSRNNGSQKRVKQSPGTRMFQRMSPKRSTN